MKPFFLFLVLVLGFSVFSSTSADVVETVGEPPELPAEPNVVVIEEIVSEANATFEDGLVSQSAGQNETSANKSEEIIEGVSEPVQGVVETAEENVAIPQAKKVVVSDGVTVVEEVTSPAVAPYAEDALDVLVDRLENPKETINQGAELEEVMEIKNRKGADIKAKIRASRQVTIVEPELMPIKKIEFNNLDKNKSQLLRMEDVPETGEHSVFEEVYAIDPSALNFTDAIVTAVAKGTALYKCKDWDFDQQTCNGEWVKLMDITPGQEYSFVLTPDDPGFAESINMCEAESLAPFDSWSGACDGTYPAACGAAADLLRCNDALTESHSASSGNQYAGVRIAQFNSSITDCNAVQDVQLCIEWWGDSGLAAINCSIAVDNTNASPAVVNTTCPGVSADPGIICQNVTSSKNWTCSNFFGASGTRAQASAQLQRSTGGTKLVFWDVFFYNVTYSAQSLGAPSPPNQTVEIGSAASISWTLNGTGGTYTVTRNGTIFEGPSAWTAGQTIVISPITFFLGDWNYTLHFNDTSGVNSTSSTTLRVVDTIFPSCSEVTGSSGSITRANITINGVLTDWDGVLTNPNNFVTDLTLLQGDPDVPGTSDRDMTKFAYTYDDTFVYFYFGRLAFGRNQISAIVYVDKNLDAAMSSSDRVAKFVWSGSTQKYDSDVYNYLPSGGSDPMLGDGFDMPGAISLNTSVESGVIGGSVAGVELEGRIPWTSLGFSGPAPVNLKAAVGQGSGTNLPTQLQDNIGGVVAASSSFLLFRQNESSSVRNGTVVFYAHDLQNCGNNQTNIQLQNLSTQTWNTTFFYPNESVISDTDSDGRPDLTLGQDDFTTLVVRIDVPSTAVTGTVDVKNVTAQSPGDNKTVTDTTTVSSDIAISPQSQSANSAAGFAVSFNYTVYNFQNFEDTIEVNASSLNGWTVSLFFSNGTALTDTDSDGNIDMGSMVFQESKGLVVRIQIPANATIGTSDLTLIQINSSVNSTITRNATANITIFDRLILVQNYSESVTAGSRNYYEMNLTNNANQSDVIDLSYTQVIGWNATFVDQNRVPLTDTDNDSVVDLGAVASGAQETFFVLIEVPNDVTANESEITLVFANSSLNTSVSRNVTINNTPRGISVFADSGRTVETDTFEIFDSVFARAFNLQGIPTVFFSWFDGVNETRISGNISVDVNGTADDEIITNASHSLGVWTIFVYDSSDNSLVTQRTFNVVDLINPNITAISPAVNSTFNISETIELAVNVTDNYAVENVTANITYPNGTTEIINLTNISMTYSANFTIPDLVGQYNVTFTANDTSGNTNSTTIFFNVVHITPPSVFDLRPVNGTQYNVSTIEIAANVTDELEVDTVFANVTFPNGSSQVVPLVSVGGDKYNSSFAIPALLGQYNVTIVANDTNNNINDTETTVFIAVDDMPPLVFNLVPIANTSFNADTVIEISADVTDNFAVDSVFANVTFPNGSSQVVPLVSVGGDKYNSSFSIPNLTGQYNITFIANDTNNNVNNTETTFFRATLDILLVVNIIEPVPDTEYNQTQQVLIIANLTKNATVTANITQPNGTIHEINLTFNGTQWFFTNNFTNTIQTGTYNVTVTATDGENISVDATNFTVVMEDTTPPQWSNNVTSPPSPATYAVQDYQFNITWTDDFGVDIVIIEHNFTGVLQNESMSNISSTYFFNQSNLSAGTYVWRSYANDTSGNENQSDKFVYVVNKANTTLNLTAEPDFTVVTGIQTNISCSADNNEVNITLYRNGTEIGSSIGGTVSDVQILAPGIYIYDCNATGGQNFADINTTNTLTVLSAAPFINFTNISRYDPSVNQTIMLNATATDNSTLLVNITLPNGTIITLPIASNYTIVLPGQHNVTFWSNLSLNISPVFDSFIAGAVPANITLNVVDHNFTGIPANLVVFLAGTNRETDVHLFTGTKTTGITDILYDLFYTELEDNITVLLRSVNLSIDNNNTLGVDKLIIPGFLLTYGVYADYNFTTADLEISYATAVFANEDTLTVSKCDDWNFTARTCGGVWVLIAATQNKTKNTFSLTTSGFSAFSIGEGASPAGGGGGGGGGGRNALICPEYCRNPQYQSVDICRSEACVIVNETIPPREVPFSGVKPKPPKAEEELPTAMPEIELPAPVIEHPVIVESLLGRLWSGLLAAFGWNWTKLVAIALILNIAALIIVSNTILLTKKK